MDKIYVYNVKQTIQLFLINVDITQYQDVKN